MKPIFDGGFEDLSFDATTQLGATNENCVAGGWFDSNINCKCTNCGTNCGTNCACGGPGGDFGTNAEC